MIRFKEELLKDGCEIYVVGGWVRDMLLGIPSKDIDLLVTNISYLKLTNILRKYGKADIIGASFGIIKFTDSETGVDMDIAIPRKDRKKATGHTGFDIETGQHVTLEEDLVRRDFTMNAIAINIVTGKIVDPLNGQRDIQDKRIRVISEETSFQDDPLRMLRAIQFASRFPGFQIVNSTSIQILKNHKLLDEITPERILMEFQKIVDKGDPYKGLCLIYDLIPKWNKYHLHGGKLDCFFGEIKTLGEFLFVSEYCLDVHKTRLFGHTSTQTKKEMKALSMLERARFSNTNEDLILGVYHAIATCPTIIDTKTVSKHPGRLYNVLDAFKSGDKIKSMKELQLTGDDLMQLGFQGVQIGEILKGLIKDVLLGLVENDKEVLLNKVKSLYL